VKKRDVDEKEVKIDDNIILPVQNQKQPFIPIIEKEKKSARSGLLFAAGGVSIAGGIAATVFLPLSKSKDIRDGKLLEDKKHTYLFAAAGIVVGGICIGSGIKLKKKESVKPLNTDFSYFTPSNINKCSRLDFVVYGNEAGLRLTF